MTVGGYLRDKDVLIGAASDPRNIAGSVIADSVDQSDRSRRRHDGIGVCMSADRADMSCVTVFCPRCRSYRVDIAVTIRGDVFLPYESLVADRAMLSFGKPRFGAGRGISAVDDFGMTRRGDGFLIHEGLTADRAMFSVGQSRSCAGRGISAVDHLGVTVCRDDLLLYEDFTADRASLAFG